VSTNSRRDAGYQYFADGRRKRLTYPDGTFITYEYNTKGWLTAIKDGGTNSIVTYDYDDAGRRTQRTLENNTFTVYDYDNADQLTSIWHQRSTGGTNTISRYQYGYDDAGNRTNMVGTAGSAVRSESYSYDAADQLTGVTYKTGSLVDRIVTYFYDAAGNRTNLIEKIGNATNTTIYAANSDNQLTSATATRQGLTVTGVVDPGAKSNKWYNSTAASRGVTAGVSPTNGTFSLPGVPVTGGANALTVTVTDVSGNIATQVVNVTIATAATVLDYDGNGNQTNDAAWSYTYDRENRLISASSTSLAVNYIYDPLGCLIERRTSGATTTTNRMYYAGWQLVAEYNGAGVLQKRYVYGPGIDELLRVTASNTNSYFHADGLGSVAEITDSSGLKAESYTYDVYGTPTIYNGSGVVTNSSAIGNRILFTGRDRDPDTSWYNYRHRYYNPNLGRFVQTDPVRISGGDANLYRYVGNRPSAGIDPSGLTDCASLKGVISHLEGITRDAIRSMSDIDQIFVDSRLNSIFSIVQSGGFAAYSLYGLGASLTESAAKAATYTIPVSKGTIPVGVIGLNTTAGRVIVAGSGIATPVMARSAGAAGIGLAEAGSEAGQDAVQRASKSAKRILDPYGRLAEVQNEIGEEMSASSYQTIADLQSRLRSLIDEYKRDCDCKQ
jgi:RHS repeat-associated protein